MQNQMFFLPWLLQYLLVGCCSNNHVLDYLFLNLNYQNKGVLIKIDQGYQFVFPSLDNQKLGQQFVVRQQWIFLCLRPQSVL